MKYYELRSDRVSDFFGSNWAELDQFVQTARVEFLVSSLQGYRYLSWGLLFF